jgi:hypothetical protein
MSLAIWPLAAQNVSLYPLAPGGTKCFIVPFSPWRHKMFHHTLWPLAAQYHTNIYLILLAVFVLLDHNRYYEK